MKNAPGIFALVLGLAAYGCQSRQPSRALIQTRFGDITIELFDSTPKHRDNFIRLANEAFYDDLLFHRVVRDFMIQGGDPGSRNAAPGILLGEGGPGYELPAETGAPHFRGAVAAARLPDAVNPQKMSNGSQFFIVQGRMQTDETLDRLEAQNGLQLNQEVRNQYKSVGGAPFLDGQYTVFGQVISGMEVIDRIAAVPRDANDRPLQDISMKVRIVR